MDDPDPDGHPLGLARVTLADKPRFDSAFKQLQAPISDYSFAMVYIWGSSLNVYWKSLHNHLCIFANGRDLTLLYPPIPENNATSDDLALAVQASFDVMDRYNEVHATRANSRIEYISDEMIEKLSALPGVNLSAAPMNADYVYETARMIDLAGGALKSKRHARGKFMRDYPGFSTAPYSDEHKEAAMALLDLWRSHGDETHEGEVNDTHVGSDILRHRDLLSTQHAIENWKELGFVGMSLFVDGKLIGFTFGEALSEQMCSVVIEKTHPEFHGSAQYIFSEFCGQFWAKYPLCNVSDDWGIPSLKFTKQSYRPVKLLSKSMLTRQAPVVNVPPSIDVPLENPVLMPTPEAVVQSALAGVEAVQEASGVLESAALNAEPSQENVGDQIVVTRSQGSDLADIMELERVCFQTVEETFNKRQVKYLLGCQRAVVDVARDASGRVVGWTVGLIRQHRKGRTGRVYALAVHPEAQGRRIGRRLAEKTLHELACRGIDRVYLEVRNDNLPAIALYRKLGFADHAQLPNYYGQGRHGLRMLLKQVSLLKPSVRQETPVSAG
jgi:ribosomal protein S18 acetylase RimI-like enzyme